MKRRWTSAGECPARELVPFPCDLRSNAVLEKPSERPQYQVFMLYLVNIFSNRRTDFAHLKLPCHNRQHLCLELNLLIYRDKLVPMRPQAVRPFLHSNIQPPGRFLIGTITWTPIIRMRQCTGTACGAALALVAPNSNLLFAGLKLAAPSAIRRQLQR